MKSKDGLEIAMAAESALSEIILENVRFRLVEPHIYSIYSQVDNVGSYDRFGSIYDVVACNPLSRSTRVGVLDRRLSFPRYQCSQVGNGWMGSGCRMWVFSLHSRNIRPVFRTTCRVVRSIHEAAEDSQSKTDESARERSAQHGFPSWGCP